MKYSDKALTLAIGKATKSLCRYKVSAMAFDKNGDYLGISSNTPRFSKYGGSTHAEMNLIKRYGEHIKFIILCRVNNKGNTLLSIHPCKRCQKILDKLKIKVYSIETNI